MSEPTQKSILLSTQDHLALQCRINQVVALQPRMRLQWQPLIDELQRAELLPAELLPAEVIRIGSTFVVRDLDTGEDDTFTLVWPEQADASGGRLSVFAPLGVAVIGFSVGDEITWRMPGGLRRLSIRSVTPPAK
jgi:regulator of nucleoside diphosphate kinase